ncbi:MAG: 50S ribosomal protein L9 [Planctomycetes bacterium]|nr:50S ribosomal protein L9 [Planctomycetota bacterium]
MSTKKNVKLLLTENIDNLGIVGDVVNVRAGYARNYLLPHNLATSPTPGNMKKVEARRAEVEKQMREQRAQREALLAKLEGFEISLMRAANEDGILYGSVSQHDIAVALQEEGFAITDRDIRIGDQIKRLDSYMIPVQIERDLKTEVKLWVVSDKPAENLMAEEDAKHQAEETEEAEA